MSNTDNSFYVEIELNKLKKIYDERIVSKINTVDLVYNELKFVIEQRKVLHYKYFNFYEGEYEFEVQNFEEIEYKENDYDPYFVLQSRESSKNEFQLLKKKIYFDNNEVKLTGIKVDKAHIFKYVTEINECIKNNPFYQNKITDKTEFTLSPLGFIIKAFDSNDPIQIIFNELVNKIGKEEIVITRTHACEVYMHENNGVVFKSRAQTKYFKKIINSYYEMVSDKSIHEIFEDIERRLSNSKLYFKDQMLNYKNDQFENDLLDKYCIEKGGTAIDLYIYIIKNDQQKFIGYLTEYYGLTYMKKRLKYILEFGGLKPKFEKQSKIWACYYFFMNEINESPLANKTKLDINKFGKENHGVTDLYQTYNVAKGKKKESEKYPLNIKNIENALILFKADLNKKAIVLAETYLENLTKNKVD